MYKWVGKIMTQKRPDVTEIKKKKDNQKLNFTLSSSAKPAFKIPGRKA